MVMVIFVECGHRAPLRVQQHALRLFPHLGGHDFLRGGGPVNTEWHQWAPVAPRGRRCCSLSNIIIPVMFISIFILYNINIIIPLMFIYILIRCPLTWDR